MARCAEQGPGNESQILEKTFKVRLSALQAGILHRSAPPAPFPHLLQRTLFRNVPIPVSSIAEVEDTACISPLPEPSLQISTQHRQAVKAGVVLFSGEELGDQSLHFERRVAGLG
jgi:hypothetical protein